MLTKFEIKLSVITNFILLYKIIAKNLIQCFLYFILGSNIIEKLPKFEKKCKLVKINLKHIFLNVN